MNAAIRSVVRVALQLGMNVYFVKEGYYGLIDGQDSIVKASWYDVSSTLSLVWFRDTLLRLKFNFKIEILIGKGNIKHLT